MLLTKINGAIVVFLEKWTIKAHIDFRGSVPLNHANVITLQTNQQRMANQWQRTSLPLLRAGKTNHAEYLPSASYYSFELCTFGFLKRKSPTTEFLFSSHPLHHQSEINTEATSSINSMANSSKKTYFFKVRDCSEFLVRRGWYFCFYQFLTRFPREGYEYFAKVPRGGYE